MFGFRSFVLLSLKIYYNQQFGTLFFGLFFGFFFLHYLYSINIRFIGQSLFTNSKLQILFEIYQNYVLYEPKLLFALN